MTLDTLTSQIIVALLGGLAAELLHWYALSRKSGRVTQYKKKPLYWGTTIGMILFAGLMPVLYLQGSASALLCFHLGAATPLILQKLVTSLPAIATAQGIDDNDSIVDFFTW